MTLSERTVGEVAELLAGDKKAEVLPCLLIGAGVSRTAGIGTATDFVEKIKNDYSNNYQRACKQASNGTPNYHQCMASLPAAHQVTLVRRDIDNAKINWAHIGIARMESAGYVEHILTPNFDPLVSRACALFNRFPAIYDLAGTHGGGVDKAGFDPSYVRGSAIFHLHGQHTGFVLLNTKEKLEEQANRIAPVLQAVAKGKPVLIAGYSGENDPLVDRIAALEPFNHGLFWICHDKNDPAPTVCEKLLSRDDCHLIREMPADRFFIELADALGLDAPRLMHDPFGHVRDVLATVAPFSDVAGSAQDELLSQARTRLQRAADSEDINPIAKLMAEGKYAAVLRTYARSTELNHDERDLVAWAAIEEGNAVSDRARASEGEEAQRLFTEAGEKYAAALAIKSDKHEALNNWGNALSDQARASEGEEAQGLFTKAGEKYAAALAITPDDHLVLNNWGNALFHWARASVGEQAQRLFAEAEEKYRLTEQILPGRATYNLACLRALGGDAEGAAEQLRASHSYATNFPGCAHLAEDADFAGVRDSTTFQQALIDIGCGPA